MFVAPRRKHYYSMVPANGGLALPAPLPPTATSPAPASPPPLSSSSLPLPRPGLEPSSPKNMHAHARRETRPYARVTLSSSPLSPPLHARTLELSASTICTCHIELLSPFTSPACSQSRAFRFYTSSTRSTYARPQHSRTLHARTRERARHTHLLLQKRLLCPPPFLRLPLFGLLLLPRSCSSC